MGVLPSHMRATASPRSHLTHIVEWSIVVLVTNGSGFLTLLTIKRLIELFQINVVTSQDQVSLDMIRPKLLSVPFVALIVGLICGWMLYRIIHHGVPRWHAFLKLGVVGIRSAALLFGLPLWLFSIFLAPPYPEIRVTAAVPGYQIEEVHYWTNYGRVGLTSW